LRQKLKSDELFCFVVCLVPLGVHEGDLALHDGGFQLLVALTAAVPRALLADVFLLELEALAAEDVEVDLADHVGHGGQRAHKTPAEPEIDSNHL